MNEKSTLSPIWQVVDKGVWFVGICNRQEVGVTQIQTDHGSETIVRVISIYFANINFYMID